MITFWFKILAVVFLVIGIASAVFTFKECGTRALFLGNGATYAAMTGMCDQ